MSNREIDTGVQLPGTDGFPLPVVPDWDKLVSKANEMVKVIDRHLDYESIYQAQDLMPTRLCRVQKVNLASDLFAVVSHSGSRIG